MSNAWDASALAALREGLRAAEPDEPEIAGQQPLEGGRLQAGAEQQPSGAGQYAPLRLELADTEWPFLGTDHDRLIVRAIVVDDSGCFYFVQAQRDDEFGQATLIETSGGGVEPGEDPDAAILRELGEELGARVEILGRLGLVSDYYNLIRRHNLNHYYLCRVLSFGEKHLTPDEIEDFHLSTLRLSYGEAILEYENRACTPLGRLIAARELPVLRRAGALLGLEHGQAEEGTDSSQRSE